MAKEKTVKEAKKEPAKKGHVKGKTPRLLELYRKTVAPSLMKEFNVENALAVPRIEKVVINMGIKEGTTDIKIVEQLQLELGRITGQHAVITRAKKAISAFKLKAGNPVGLKVTLRKNRMYEFIDRLFNIAMPRIRDFRGYSPNSFDQQGNYSLGIQEQIIFPEVEYDKVKKLQGMDVTFVTSCHDQAQVKRMLELLGFPFRK